MVKTVRIYPVADVNTTWSQEPDDGLARYLKVDEDPLLHNGDADYLYATADEQIFILKALPGDLKHSTGLQLRVAARSGSFEAILGFAFTIDGVDYVEDNAFVDWSVLSLGPWHILEFDLPSLPVLTGPEEIRLSLRHLAGGFRIDAGAVDLFVTYETKPDTGKGHGHGGGPKGDASTDAPSSSAAAESPAASGATGGPVSSPSSQAPSAQAEAAAVAVISGAGAPRQKAAPPGTVSAGGSSGSPRAAGSPGGQTAAGSAEPSAGEGD